MQLRTIIIASTARSGIKELQSEARTWGQLKDALGSEFGDLGKMRAVVRETRNDLESDEAVLPTDNHTILLTVKQIKAGTTKTDVAEVLRAFQDKFNDSIDELVNEVEGGIYEVEDRDVIKTQSSALTEALRKDLELLSKGQL